MITAAVAQITLSVGAQCVLTGAPEYLKKELRNSLTLPNPKYQAAKKYGRWVGNKIPQKLYFYKDLKSGFIIPRGFARKAVLLCIEILRISPEIHDKRRSLPSCKLTFDGDLRGYQEKAISDIIKRDFGVLIAGTGSGKTVVGLKAISLRAQPAIILVHSKELLYQWANQVNKFLGIEAGLIGDGKYVIAPVTIGIVNSVKKHIDELPQHFGHLLVDECHRVPASLFTDVVTSFDSKYSLGLSATAYRRENILTKLIFFYMGSCVHEVDTNFLQTSGAILKPEILIKYTEFTYRYRDNYAAMMKALTKDEDRNRLIVLDIVNEARNSDSTILVVSDRVEHCNLLFTFLAEMGVSSSVLTGKTTSENRALIVEGISNNSVKVLISTVQLIGEGFDSKQLSTLFLATPIKFSGRLKQVIGRVLRPGDEKKARVYDYVDQHVGVLENSARERSKTYSSYGC